MSWSAFLDTQSLPPTADTPWLAPVEHLTVVRARGEEADHYLQGQLSCDLRAVDQGAHLTGMHLSLKGRGLVSVRIGNRHNAGADWNRLPTVVVASMVIQNNRDGILQYCPCEGPMDPAILAGMLLLLVPLAEAVHRFFSVIPLPTTVVPVDCQ